MAAAETQTVQTWLLAQATHLQLHPGLQTMGAAFDIPRSGYLTGLQLIPSGDSRASV